MAEKVIVYFCWDCRDYNKHMRDDPRFEEKNPELLDFSAAVQHVMGGHYNVSSIVRDEENEQ